MILKSFMIASLFPVLGALSNGPGKLDLRLTLQTAEVLEPGPIIVRVELRNPSSSSIVVNPKMRLNGAFIYEYLLGSEHLTISAGPILCGMGGDNLTLLPGAALTWNLELSETSTTSGDFVNPIRQGAAIRIRASSPANGVDATSPPINVTSRADREDLEFLSDIYSFSGASKLKGPERSEKMEAFLAKHPNDPAGIPLALGFAEDYRHKASSTRRGPEWRSYLEKSQHWYLWLIDHHPESFFAPEAAFRLADLANMEDKLDEAQRAIVLVEQKFLDGLDWESRLQFESIKRGVKYKLTPPNQRSKEKEAPPGPEIFVRKP